MGKSRVSKAQHVLLLLLVLSVFIIFAGCFNKGNDKDTSSYTLPTGTVTGIITSTEGDPLQGALVSIGACSSLTDVKGKFTLTGVPPGSRQILTVFLEGYVNYSVEIDINKEQTLTLNLPMAALPPPPPDDPDDPPPPPAPGSVTGTVTENLLSRPRCGAVVTIGGLSATTAADGTYTINGVPAGNNAVTATLGGYKNYAGAVTVVSNQSVTKDFKLVQDCGRYVVFDSAAQNILPGHAGGTSDIFLYDRQTQAYQCVSVADDGTPGNGGSSAAGASTDNRYIAFQSTADNLVANDTNGFSDIFVRDTVGNTTTLVSVATDGTQGNADSYSPSMSADGRYVVFLSYATNMVAGDFNGWNDIFVRDLQTRTTTLSRPG